MTLLTADAKAAGGVEGCGGTLVVDHTADNTLMAFRFKNADVKMLAAEEDFDARRPQIPRRRVHHSQCRSRAAGAGDSRTWDFRRGPSRRRRR